MINRIEIDGFKNLSATNIDLKRLTVITGKNSTGKSSLLHSILLTQVGSQASIHYDQYYSIHFASYRNRYTNAKTIHCKYFLSDSNPLIEWNEEKLTIHDLDKMPELEKELFYLSANRKGASNVAPAYPSYLVAGPEGEALFSTLEREKSQPVAEELVRNHDSLTLTTQVNHWLSYILECRLEISTQRRSTQEVEIKFRSDELPDVLPSQLGAGVGYLVKILILCLRSKKEDVIMIENPEIHLYPRAQARLAEFLSFIASSDRQLLIETHSNELITKLRHEVFKGKLSPDDIVVLYKNGITSPFEEIHIDRNGQFTSDFPETFFDSTLAELLEMD